jgi:hypothetical protein
MKFVPCYNLNKEVLFLNFLKNFDLSIYRFNKILFFRKKQILKSINTEDPRENYNDSNISDVIRPSPGLNSQDFYSYFNDITDILSIMKPKINLNSNNVKNKQFISKEIIDLRLNVLKYIDKIQLEINKNISYSDLKCLRAFKKQNNFKVIECDKNVGLCIIPVKEYNKVMLDHLNNQTLYQELDNNPLKETIQSVSNELNDMKKQKLISKELYNRIKPISCSIGKIRLLPKLHKPEFSFRPIINCKNQPTAKISLFIDLLLRKITEKAHSYIKDSQGLLLHCNDLIIEKNSILYSCDFSALYTNIDSIKCINTITHYISNLLNSKDLKLNGFTKLLKLVFFNNIFEFNGNYYKQIKGISMGIICGPTLANLYLMLLESQFIKIQRPIVYKRFIDDIFIILAKELRTEEFNTYFDGLELNIKCGDSVIFLDLIINICKLSNTLWFDLYIKPTNTFGYIKTNSNHPSKIILNVPKSLFIRIRRICTYLFDYLFHSRKLIQQLIQRGFIKDKIEKIARIVACLNRDKLLPYKRHDKDQFKSNDKLLLIKCFDKNQINIEN